MHLYSIEETEEETEELRTKEEFVVEFIKDRQISWQELAFSISYSINDYIANEVPAC